MQSPELIICFQGVLHLFFVRADLPPTMLLGWHSAAMHCGSVQLSLVNWIIQEGDCNTLMGKTGEYSIFAVCCLEEGLHIVMPVGSENLVTGQCGLGVEARGTGRYVRCVACAGWGLYLGQRSGIPCKQ